MTCWAMIFRRSSVVSIQVLRMMPKTASPKNRMTIVSRPEYSRISLRRMVMEHQLLFFAQDVAHPTHRMNQAGSTLGLGFLAQVAHINLDDIALPSKVITPNPVKNYVAGQNLSRITHKQFEE